jgi:hypothetical protein
MLKFEVLIGKAILFCLSLVVAAILSGLVLSIVVVVRLTATGTAMFTELPWVSFSVFCPLLIVLFREAERNRKYLIGLWDRLRDDIRCCEAIGLVNSIEDGGTRDKARAQLALGMISARRLAQK